MHAIKGGWVGQTFALAKRNESEGRKSRIRRSKEERKEMVESFIKKYQQSNNGNFPSLNLMHKEVGGSFYTVREIVRDIIQDNRVLGPAKFKMVKQSSDQFLEEKPLGSLASDPQTYLVRSSNENYLEPNNLHDTNETMLIDSGGLYTVTGHQMVDNGQVINGSQVDLANKVSNEVTSPKLQVRETLEPKQSAEQELATPLAKVTPVTADVIVETVPLRPVTRTTDKTEEGLSEVIDISNSPHSKIKVLDLEQGKDRSDINSIESAKNFNSFDEESVEDPGNLASEKKSGTGGEEEENNVSNEVTSPKLQVREALEPKQNAEQELTTPLAKVTPVKADVIAETFPLRPVTRTTDKTEEGFSEVIDLSNSPHSKMKVLDLEQGKDRSDINGMESAKNSNSSDEKSVDDPGNLASEKKSGTGCEEEENKVSIEVTSPKLQVGEALEPKQNAEQELATPLTKVSPVTADVIVETFPLRPVTRKTDKTEGFGEVVDLSNSPHIKTKVLDLEQGKDRSDIDGMESAKNSNSFDEKSVDDPRNLVSEKNSGSGDEEEEKNLGETLMQSTEQSNHTKHFDHEIEGCTDPQTIVPDQSVVTSETIEPSHIDGAAATSVQEGFDTKNLTNNYTGGSKATMVVQKNVNDQRADSQAGNSSQKRSNPTLDRINLESWDGTHKNSVKPEANPLLAIFRAFVDAFVKFWSE